MIRRINLYGPPGSGKSTYAAYIFSILKRRGFNVELVTEAIKPWCYQDRHPMGYDQVYLFIKQLRREEQYLRHGVNLIVTDSPLYLNCAYAEYHNTPGANFQYQVARQFEETYPGLHYFCQSNFPQQPLGRYESSPEFTQFLQERLSWWRFEPLPSVDPTSFDLSWLIKNLRTASVTSTSTEEKSLEPPSNSCEPSSASSVCG